MQFRNKRKINYVEFGVQNYDSIIFKEKNVYLSTLTLFIQKSR